MRAVAVGLLLEEQRGEIVAAWRSHVEHELGGEPALAFAVGPLLREMSLALREDPSPFGTAEAVSLDGGGARAAVLVRSGAASARVAREFKLLHRAVWDALRRGGAVVGADERRAADEWLDEALAATLDRQDRLRTRADLLDGAPAPQRKPTAPWEPDVRPIAPAAPSRTPPPLPSRVTQPSATRPPAAHPPVAVPARPPPLPRSPPRSPPPVAEPSFSALE
ncbi:MAG TPA: hypothetical protein VF841_12670 [Anaeromyxobacter sp.]